MSGLKILKGQHHGSSRQLSLSLVLAAILTGVVIAPASAATVTSTWNARVGTSGANGTARIQAYATGNGAATLKLVKLRRSSLLPVVISKGTCSSVGATVATLASIKTTSAGAATRTSSLTAAQIKLIKAATRGTGKIAIRIGTGTARKCGLFVLATPAIVVPPSIVATIPVGAFPQGTAIDATGIWVTNTFDSSLSRIDPNTNSVLSVTRVVVPGNSLPVAVTSAFGSLWVSFETYDASFVNQIPGFVQRVDPLSGMALGNPIPVGREPSVLASSPEAIWVSNWGDGSVSRIDPTSGQVTATIPVGGSPFGIAAGFGSIWVANEDDGKVARIDPATNQVVATVQTQLNAEGVAVGAGSVWVSNFGITDQAGGMVSRIDPTTNAVVAVVPVGTNPGFVSFGGGYLWVAMVGESTVVQVDPVKNAVKTRTDVGAKSWGIAAADRTVWVVHQTAAGADATAFLPGTVTRINF